MSGERSRPFVPSNVPYETERRGNELFWNSRTAGTGEWLKSDGSPQDTFPQIRAWAELRQAAAEILMQVHPNRCPKFSLLLGLASISHFRLPGQRECIPSTFIRGLRPQMWLGRSLVLIRNCETNL